MCSFVCYVVLSSMKRFAFFALPMLLIEETQSGVSAVVATFLSLDLAFHGDQVSGAWRGREVRLKGTKGALKKRPKWQHSRRQERHETPTSTGVDWCVISKASKGLSWEHKLGAQSHGDDVHKQTCTNPRNPRIRRAVRFLFRLFYLCSDRIRIMHGVRLG